jgi:hypothetical protein
MPTKLFSSLSPSPSLYSKFNFCMSRFQIKFQNSFEIENKKKNQNLVYPGRSPLALFLFPTRRPASLLFPPAHLFLLAQPTSWPSTPSHLPVVVFAFPAHRARTWHGWRQWSSSPNHRGHLASPAPLLIPSNLQTLALLLSPPRAASAPSPFFFFVTESHREQSRVAPPP